MNNSTTLASKAVAITLLIFANSTFTAAQEEAEPSSRETLTLGINHVGLTVSDLEKSTAFFTETLDWKEVGGYPDYPSKFVTDGKIFLTLWQATNPETATPFDRKNNIGLHHLALTVTSFEGTDK